MSGKKAKAKTKAKTKPASSKTMLVNFILDSSGSMGSIKDDTIGGFNEYLRQLRKEDGKDGVDYRFTLTLFGLHSVSHRIVYNSVPLASVADLTPTTYTPENGTPMYEAIGETIESVEKHVSEGKEMTVLTVIMTDGQENASHNWCYDADTPEATAQNRLRAEMRPPRGPLKGVKQLISRLQATGKWTFVFLGVGEDRWVKETAMNIGIHAGNTTSYSHTGQHVNSTMRAVANMTNVRKSNYGVRGMTMSMDSFKDADVDVDDLLSAEDRKKKYEGTKK